MLVVAWRDWVDVTTFIRSNGVCMLESFNTTSFWIVFGKQQHILRLNWISILQFGKPTSFIIFPILITCFRCQFVIELTCLTPYCILGGCLVVTTKENEICIAIQTSLLWFELFHVNQMFWISLHLLMHIIWNWHVYKGLLHMTCTLSWQHQKHFHKYIEIMSAILSIFEFF